MSRRTKILVASLAITSATLGAYVIHDYLLIKRVKEAGGAIWIDPSGLMVIVEMLAPILLVATVISLALDFVKRRRNHLLP